MTIMSTFIEHLIYYWPSTTSFYLHNILWGSYDCYPPFCWQRNQASIREVNYLKSQDLKGLNQLWTQAVWLQNSYFNYCSNLEQSPPKYGPRAVSLSSEIKAGLCNHKDSLLYQSLAYSSEPILKGLKQPIKILPRNTNTVLNISRPHL